MYNFSLLISTTSTSKSFDLQYLLNLSQNLVKNSDCSSFIVLGFEKIKANECFGLSNILSFHCSCKANSSSKPLVNI